MIDEEKLKKHVEETIRAVREDIKATRERDPAARSDAEVALLYSGVHAMMAYRVAHKLYRDGHYFSARALSQMTRKLTGIEIHPGARIGRRFVIDHGNGIKTRYAHMYPGSLTVRVGQRVYQGQQIGRIGSTGNSTGPHLHFEMLVNGYKENPLPYIR